MSLWSVLASLKLTLIGMLALAVGVLISYWDAAASVFWVALPLCLLALNLVTALSVDRRFRRQSGLIVFHLCLLAVLLLAAAGRLSSFKGRVEVTEGQRFDPATVTVVQQGPWHPLERLSSVAFEQAGIRVEYAPGLRRGATTNTLQLLDEKDQTTIFTMGDTRPFKAAGYRFYTTSNKGYAVVLRWTGDGGEIQRGTVHLPSFPLYDWKQLNQWTTPAGTTIDLEYQPDNKAQTENHWVLDSTDTSGSLTVILHDQRRHRLQPGPAIRLPGGELRYEGPRMWMGYQVFFDPMLPWLFAAAMIGVLGLAWHYWGKLWSRPLAQSARAY